MDTLTEIEEKQRAERRQLQSDAEALEMLLQHPGWKRYAALVETVAQNYHVAVMKPIESLLESPRVEFNKGALSGLSLAMSLPGMKIKEAADGRQGDDDERT